MLKLEALLDIVSDVQDLVSIGTGHTAEIVGVTLQRSDVPLRTSTGETVGLLPLEYFARWAVRERRPPKTTLRAHRMYFTLDDLGGIIGLAKWMVVAEKYRTALGRIMAAHYADGMFESDRVVNGCAAIQGFDKKRKADKVKDVAVALRRSAALADKLFVDLVGDVEAWIVLVVAHRNDAAHHYDRYLGGAATREQRLLADSIYWLLVLVLIAACERPSGSVFAYRKSPRLLRLEGAAGSALEPWTRHRCGWTAV